MNSEYQTPPPPIQTLIHKSSSAGVIVFLFDSLRPLNNLSVMREGSSWVEPVLI